MLVLPCFPEIARRGFAKFVWPNLAKPMRFRTPSFSQTPTFAVQNKKGGNEKAQTFATRKRVCAGVAKGPKGGRQANFDRCGFGRPAHSASCTAWSG